MLSNTLFRDAYAAHRVVFGWAPSGPADAWARLVLTPRRGVDPCEPVSSVMRDLTAHLLTTDDPSFIPASAPWLSSASVCPVA